MRTFLENERVERLANGAVAGHGDTITSSTLDTAGYDSITFIAAIGAVDPTGTVVMTVQQGDASNGSDATDLEGATASAGADDDNGLLIVDVYRPQKRYLTVTIDRGVADSVVDGVIAILRDPQTLPVTQSDDVIASVFVASPAESA